MQRIIARNSALASKMGQIKKVNTDRKNVTDFLYLVLHLACKVTCYFQLFSSVLVSVLRTSINVLSKSKSKNYVTWIANLTKLFLSVWLESKMYSLKFLCGHFQRNNCSSNCNLSQFFAVGLLFIAVLCVAKQFFGVVCILYSCSLIEILQTTSYRQ